MEQTGRQEEQTKVLFKPELLALQDIQKTKTQNKGKEHGGAQQGAQQDGKQNDDGLAGEGGNTGQKKLTSAGEMFGEDNKTQVTLTRDESKRKGQGGKTLNTEQA